MKKHQNSSVYRFILRNSVIPDDLALNQQFSLEQATEDEIFFQLTRVFRCQEGVQITLLNQQKQAPGQQCQFQIQKIEKKRLVLQLISKKEITEAFNYQLELALGLPNKPSKLDFILQKATELTASTIHLIQMDRSQLAHQLKIERMNKILIEAAEQTERVSLPEIKIHQNLSQFLNSLKESHKNQQLFVAMERSSSTTKSLLDLNLPGNPIILIGPEGGFSPNEIDMLTEFQALNFNLGGTILRNETACLLSLGIASLKLQS